ncbi:MAG: uracil-DNA glycosylase family protein [Spirochaeta sp.]
MHEFSVSPLLNAARDLAEQVDLLRFEQPVEFVYNPLQYAWKVHAAYITRFANSTKDVVFVGMNPGPYGMAQTGVPFGEIHMVRNWMGLYAEIDAPPREHPKRPVTGFSCPKSEVSGRRLWGLMQQRFGSADSFFRNHFVVNYCPLVFMEESSRNRTPNQLRKNERRALFELCDHHLLQVLQTLQPNWVIGVGKFAEECAARAVASMQSAATARTAGILHPSPANPHANRGWAETAAAQLETAGVWPSSAANSAPSSEKPSPETR